MLESKACFRCSTHKLRQNKRPKRLNLCLNPFSFRIDRLFSPRQLFQPAQDWSKEEEEFVEWLRSHGVVTSPLHLQPQCGGKGRGLIATKRIKKGTRVINIPLHEVITPSSALALALSSLAPLIKDTRNPPSDWALLSLYLVDLKHNQGANSYLNMLPLHPGSVLDLGPQEFRRLFVLSSSPYQGKAERIIQAASASINESMELIRLSREAGCPMFPDLNEEQAKADLQWALSICLSRAIRLETSPGNQGTSYQLALVPWADFLNHDPSSTSFIHLSRDPQSSSPAVVFITDRDYEPGDEVAATYGTKSSLELLLSYGFCPDPTTNPHHCYHLPIELDVKDPCYDVKMEALTKRAMAVDWLSLALEEGSIPIKIEGYPQELLNLIAFVDSRPRPSEVEDIANWLIDKNQLPVVSGDDMRVVALNGLRQRCKMELSRLSPAPALSPAAAQKLGRSTKEESREVGMRERQWQDALQKIQERDRRILQRVEFVASSEARKLVKSKQ